MPKPTAAANATPMPAPTRRALLKATGALGTIAALAVPVTVLPKAESASVDPVFAAIAAHQDTQTALCRALDAFNDAEEEHGVGTADALGPEITALHRRDNLARLAAVQTVPTTVLGMRALLDQLMKPEVIEAIIDRDAELMALLGTFRAFIDRQDAA